MMEFKRVDSVAASACCMCMRGVGHQPAIVRHFDVICLPCARKIANLLTKDELEYRGAKPLPKGEWNLLNLWDRLTADQRRDATEALQMMISGKRATIFDQEAAVKGEDAEEAAETEDAGSAGSAPRFVCPYCGKRGRSEEQLQNHIQKHRVKRALEAEETIPESLKHGLKTEVLA
jgi:hypothetical protein